MFLLNEKVVYPGYGVATISKLVQRFISGKEKQFYELKFFNKEMAVLVPEDRIETVGIRRLSSEQDLEAMFYILAQQEEKTQYSEAGVNNWNKRNKRYQLNIRSGNLSKISLIYKDLQIIAQDKELSFGERNLCTKIESLLVEEISIVKKIHQDKALEYLRKPFKLAVKDK